MHCTPKKTVQQIVAGGNDYLIAVKANQGTLFSAMQAHFEQGSPLSVATQVERAHGRQMQRTVTVLMPPDTLDPAWVGVQRVVQVERKGTRSGKPFAETMFYFSSIAGDAPAFATRIRAHWQIENALHWVKDVVLGEDDAPLCAGHALTNFAIVRTIAVNLFRVNGFASITKGIRALAHDLHRLFSFLQ
jgi:predicted transposase YbfD/YdcC